MNQILFKEISKLTKSDDLIKGNLRLVIHIAKKYQNLNLSLDDLIQEGLLGLCTAAEKYDETKGKFSVYASYWIKAMIMQALNNNSRVVRVPTNLKHIANTLSSKVNLDNVYNVSYSPSIDKEHDDSDIKYKVNKLMLHLKPKQQQILKMKYGIDCDHEYSSSEIAKELKLTIQAVNVNLRKSFEKLQSIML